VRHAIALALVALCVPTLARPQNVRVPGAGTIVGAIGVQGAPFPLPYSVVSAPTLGRERFTSASGQFTLEDLPAGRVAIRVKRIGYLPLDTLVEVRAGDTTRVELFLEHVPAQLPAIRTTAQACIYPGIPADGRDLRLAVLLEQVKENAERHRLLSRSYPFEYQVQRTMSKWEPDSGARIVETDTLLRTSQRSWRYAPGRVMGSQTNPPGRFGGQWITMIIPDLGDIADDDFLRNHCFDYAGMDVVDGDSILRVDFVPAPGVRTPDIAGSLYLDRSSYQIRRSSMSLVNLTPELKRLVSAQQVETTFKEILPGVPILHEVSSTVSPSDYMKVIIPEPSLEYQRLIGVRFLSGKP